MTLDMLVDAQIVLIGNEICQLLGNPQTYVSPKKCSIKRKPPLLCLFDYVPCLVKTPTILLVEAICDLLLLVIFYGVIILYHFVVLPLCCWRYLSRLVTSTIELIRVSTSFTSINTILYGFGKQELSDFGRKIIFFLSEKLEQGT